MLRDSDCRSNPDIFAECYVCARTESEWEMGKNRNEIDKGKNFHFHSSKHIGLIAVHAFKMWFYLLFICKTISILRFDAHIYTETSLRTNKRMNIIQSETKREDRKNERKRVYVKRIRSHCVRGLRFVHRVHFEIRHSFGYCCLRYCCKFDVDWCFVKRIE